MTDDASQPTVPQFETLLVDLTNSVATVSLNRPDRYHAFNDTMLNEMAVCWQWVRSEPAVRCVVLTATGESAFCTGIDRDSIPTSIDEFTFDPFTYDDPGARLGPKSQGCWKPVIAAVNGMACGGAFYMLGEVEFIIAADHATFFDPHVTYGMAAILEPTLLAPRMPFGEVMRMMLLGAHEHLSADRAQQIGLVSEVVPAAELADAARWAAEAIASQPAQAVQATVRNLWMAKELSRQQAVDAGAMMLSVGSSVDNLKEGQEFFASGRRIRPKVR